MHLHIHMMSAYTVALVHFLCMSSYQLTFISLSGKYGSHTDALVSNFKWVIKMGDKLQPRPSS